MITARSSPSSKLSLFVLCALSIDIMDYERKLEEIRNSFWYPKLWVTLTRNLCFKRPLVSPWDKSTPARDLMDHDVRGRDFAKATQLANFDRPHFRIPPSKVLCQILNHFIK